MTTIETAILLSGVLLILVLIGVRVAFATALIGILGMFLFYTIDKGMDPMRAITVTLKL